MIERCFLLSKCQYKCLSFVPTKNFPPNTKDRNPMGNWCTLPVLSSRDNGRIQSGDLKEKLLAAGGGWGCRIAMNIFLISLWNLNSLNDKKIKIKILGGTALLANVKPKFSWCWRSFVHLISGVSSKPNGPHHASFAIPMRPDMLRVNGSPPALMFYPCEEPQEQN